MSVRRRVLAALLPLAVAVAVLPAAMSEANAQDCQQWAGQTALQDAVNQYECVQIEPGVWEFDHYIVVPAGHTVRGVPGGDPADTVLRAVAPWENTAAEGILNDDGTNGTPFTVTDLTLDGAGLSTAALCCRAFTARDLVLEGGRCFGFAVAGAGVDIRQSTIRGNGAWEGCPSAPGAGVYVISTVDGPSEYAPNIIDNRIVDNTGPGLDIDRVWGGQLIGNTITGNTSWAGISLFGANWLIEGNTVSHPSTDEGQPYQEPCASGPDGEHSAGIMLCQLSDEGNIVTTGNTVRNNKTSAYYGILLVGNDETQPYWAPRNNTITGNDVTGSNHGCADDFRPGQWEDDQNIWTDNNCTGAPNSPPSYF